MGLKGWEKARLNGPFTSECFYLVFRMCTPWGRNSSVDVFDHSVETSLACFSTIFVSQSFDVTILLAARKERHSTQSSLLRCVTPSSTSISIPLRQNEDSILLGSLGTSFGGGMPCMLGKRRRNNGKLAPFDISSSSSSNLSHFSSWWLLFQLIKAKGPLAAADQNRHGE